MATIVAHAIVWGVALAVVLFAMVLVLLRINPETMLNDYPPDIRAKWGRISPKARRQRNLFAILVVIALVGILWSSGHSLLARTDRPISFGAAFVHFGVIMQTFNLLDLVALDWPMVYLQPKFVVLPGTEGMAGYRDYWFPFRGFLIGTGFSVVFGAVAGLVTWLVQ